MSFRLTCWAYDWNGEKFNRVPYDFYIEHFDGTKSINTLDHCPLYYHTNTDKVRNRLINRGKRYRDLCICKSGSQMFDYNGFTIEDQKGITRHDTGQRVRWTLFYLLNTKRPIVQLIIFHGINLVTEPRLTINSQSLSDRLSVSVSGSGRERAPAERAASLKVGFADRLRR